MMLNKLVRFFLYCTMSFGRLAAPFRIAHTNTLNFVDVLFPTLILDVDLVLIVGVIPPNKTFVVDDSIDPKYIYFGLRPET